MTYDKKITVATVNITEVCVRTSLMTLHQLTTPFYSPSGYEQLIVSDSLRDNFFVRARYSHHKTRGDFGLDYARGDVFHVLDTKPQGS